jgi:hypothetical protein
MMKRVRRSAIQYGRKKEINKGGENLGRVIRGSHDDVWDYDEKSEKIGNTVQ